MFKKIMAAIVLGAATTFGSILMTKGSDAMEQPANREKLKKTASNIKKKLGFGNDNPNDQETNES